MKKILLLITTLAFVAIGCNENKKDDKAVTTVTDSSKVVKKAMPQKIDWTKYTEATPEDVQAMANHYNELVSKNPAIGIQQINMDGTMLSLLVFEAKGLKLIAAADLKTNEITMYMQFWMRDSFYYYNIKDFFVPEEPGMRGQPVLCPPPSGCDLPMNKGIMPNVMTQADAVAMAKNYTELVLKNPAIAVQQITMDALLLELLLYGTEGLKLTLAADLKTNETTVVMQFWRNEEFSYYDIRDIFAPGQRGMRGQPPLCPPPTGCDLPFLPAPAMKK